MISSDKLIATAVNGKNKTRFFGIRFELLSQMNDVRIDGARGRIILVSPNCIQQSIAAECLYGMRNEVGQQGKLLRREIDDVSFASHFVAANVHFDVAEFVNLRRGRR